MRSQILSTHSQSQLLAPPIAEELHPGELSTSHLDDHLLLGEAGDEEERAAQPHPTIGALNTDWLRVLAAHPEEPWWDADEQPELPAQPSGMAAHSRPPRITPTLGTRIRLGLKRGLLFVIVSALAVAVVVGGIYALTYTPWFASTPAPAPACGSCPEATGAVAAPPVKDASGASSAPGSQSNALPPQNQGQSQATGSDAKLTGPDELRKQGLEQYKAGRFDQAIQLYEDANAMDGGDAVSFYQLGLAFMAASGREHALEDAEMAFRTAASLQPTWASPYQLLAESLIREALYSAAIEPAHKAVQFEPDNGPAWETLGRAYHGAGQEAEATRAFAEAARLSPGVPPLAPPPDNH